MLNHSPGIPSHCKSIYVLSGFTGIDSAYEPPEKPDLVLPAGQLTVDECVQRIVKMLVQGVSAAFVTCLKVMPFE